MARAGILYSHVAKAASQLAAAGKNPTVDNVREAMGGTGSKSTIAPMLKQWKAQHEGEVAAAGTGLPADLLEAIKGVYDRVQVSGQAQVEQLRIEYQLAANKAAQEAEALRDEVSQRRIEREALKAELDSVKAALARERAARHQDAVAIAALESDKAGQAQRLADRSAEVGGLADQLAQARLQFEHFQAASVAQRQDDKHAYETRITRAEQEAASLRANLQDDREALAVLRSEKAYLEHSLAEQREAASEQAGRLYEVTEGLIATREMASNGQLDLGLTIKRLEHANQANLRLEARLRELEGEYGLSKAQVARTASRKRPRKT